MYDPIAAHHQKSQIPEKGSRDGVSDGIARRLNHIPKRERTRKGEVVQIESSPRLVTFPKSGALSTRSTETR